MERPSEPAALPFRELVDEVLSESLLLGRSPLTDRHYSLVAKQFERWAAGEAPALLADIRPVRRADLEAFLLWRRGEGLMWSSIKTEWNYLRAILRQAVWSEHLTQVPTVRVRWEAKIAEDRRARGTLERGHRVLELVPRCLEVADELAYYRSVPLALPSFLRFLAYTGARTGEVLPRDLGAESTGLRWRDIERLDGDDPVVSIRGGKGRAHGVRRIPLPEPAAEALRALDRGEPDDYIWPWKCAWKPWEKVRLVAAERGAPDAASATRALRVHDLRHYASHYWRSLGVPDRIIDRLLGHRTPVIAARYAAADEREVGAACAQALRRSEPPEPRGEGRAVPPDAPEIITLGFEHWHRLKGASVSGGEE